MRSVTGLSSSSGAAHVTTRFTVPKTAPVTTPHRSGLLRSTDSADRLFPLGECALVVVVGIDLVLEYARNGVQTLPFGRCGIHVDGSAERDAAFFREGADTLTYPGCHLASLAHINALPASEQGSVW